MRPLGGCESGKFWGKSFGSFVGRFFVVFVSFQAVLGQFWSFSVIFAHF